MMDDYKSRCNVSILSTCKMLISINGPGSSLALGGIEQSVEVEGGVITGIAIASEPIAVGVYPLPEVTATGICAKMLGPILSIVNGAVVTVKIVP